MSKDGRRDCHRKLTALNPLLDSREISAMGATEKTRVGLGGTHQFNEHLLDASLHGASRGGPVTSMVLLAFTDEESEALERIQKRITELGLEPFGSE